MSGHDMDDQPSPELLKGFDLKKAWEEVKADYSSGSGKDKAASTAKLLGKSLWNAGLHIVKNAPAQLEKMKEDAEKNRARLEKLEQQLQSKSNAVLIDTVKNGKDDDKRRIAYKILKARKEAMEAESN